MQRPLSQAVSLFKRGFIPQQTRTLVSGPPTQRVSLAEKVAYSSVMAFSFLAVPVWVIVHIRSYRDRS
ncbi:hypothetical protein GE061_019679 [Apolygus lucorum]|uniref:Uncharacterized protein n=1 Tax=Apolygus lucorum TaxID=248454 RepID=A0A6A4JPV5_APOLU|nr:hypothetical protein GE061_019679 [Apolygus lucorum]